MTKKEYVVTLLKALVPEWSMARGLLVLVENNVFDDSTIDALVSIFKEAISSMKNDAQQAKLQRGLDYLTQLKEKEASEMEAEAHDLEDMEKMMEEFG